MSTANVHTRILIQLETSAVCNPYRLLTCLALCCIAGALPAETLVFKNTNIVDATGDPVQMFMDVLISDAKITQIAPTGSVPITAGARVIDASGRYLIPGLWDMHTHVAEPHFVNGFADHKLVVLPLLVANGVTGIRDMGGDWDLLKQYRNEINGGQLIGPRIIGTSLMLDGPGSFFPGTLIVATSAEGRKAVRDFHAQGVDFIKIQSFITHPVFTAIVEEARALNLDVVGHVPFSMSAVDVSNAGVRSIEHLTGSIFKQTRLPFVAGQLYSAEERAGLVRSYADNGTWHVPTHILMRAYINTDSIVSRTDPRLKYIPDYWISAIWNPFLEQTRASRTNADIAEINAVYARERYAVTRELRNAGVQFLAGTDFNVPYVLPGFSLHDELVLLNASGLTTMEALQAATSRAAKFLGLDAELGTVEVGKAADLVLVDGDPLEDIRNTQRINAVVRQGQLFTRADLDTILNDVQVRANK